MSRHSLYKVGLGRPFLDRAGLTFTLVILVAFIFGSTAVYAEYKTGQLREKIVRPAQKFISEVAGSFKNIDPPKNLTNPNILISTSSATIKIETNINTGSKKNNAATSVTYPASPPVKYNNTNNNNNNNNTKSYEQSVKEMNDKADAAYQEALKQQAAWSAQKQQENQAWFQQTSAQNDTAAKASYDAAVKKMQEDTEAWKKAHGF